MILLLLLAALSAAAPEIGRRDYLWHIVSACLDPKAPDYCDACARPLD